MYVVNPSPVSQLPVATGSTSQQARDTSADCCSLVALEYVRLCRRASLRRVRSFSASSSARFRHGQLTLKSHTTSCIMHISSECSSASLRHRVDNTAKTVRKKYWGPNRGFGAMVVVWGFAQIIGRRWPPLPLSLSCPHGPYHFTFRFFGFRQSVMFLPCPILLLALR